MAIPSTPRTAKKQAGRVKRIRERLAESAAVEEPPAPPDQIIEEPAIREVEFDDEQASSLKSKPASSQPRVQSARAGLDWLAKHQDQDGRWDADQFIKHDVGGCVWCATRTPRPLHGTASIGRFANRWCGWWCRPLLEISMLIRAAIAAALLSAIARACEAAAMPSNCLLQAQRITTEPSRQPQTGSLNDII